MPIGSRPGGVRGRALLFNPAAGSMPEDPADLIDLIDPTVLLRTAAAGDAEALAREASGDLRELVVAGGDGTISEAVNGVAAAEALGDLVLGLVPLGTGNDLARGLGVPLDTPAAAIAFSEGRERRIDLIRARSARGARLIANTSAGGLGSRVGEALAGDLKRWLGPLAFVWEGLARLGELQPYELELDLDGRVRQLSAFSHLIANGPSVAGGMRPLGDARLDDGLLDVLVVPAADERLLAEMVTHIESGEPFVEGVLTHRARRATLRSAPVTPFNGDGEMLGETPVTYEVLPGALRVRVP